MELDPRFRGLLNHFFRVFRPERRIPTQQDICNYPAWYPGTQVSVAILAQLIK